MNLGKFHYAVWNLHVHYHEAELLNHFDQAVAALAAYNAAPTKANSGLFREKIAAVYAAIDKAPGFLRLPSMTDALTEIGAINYYGTGLRERLQTIVNSGGAVPAELSQSLAEERAALGKFVAEVTKLAESMDELTVEYDKLGSTEYEFGLMYPKELIGESIDSLIGELKHISRFLAAVNELVGRGSEQTKVRTISASWWQFFLELDYTQVAAITFAIERCIALYKSGLEIKKLRREAEAANLGEEILSQIDAKIALKTKEGLAQIAAEFRSEFALDKDAERNNELETQFRLELTFLMHRLSEGAKVEVRTPVLRAPQRPDEQQLASNPLLENEYLSKVEQHSRLELEVSTIEQKSINLNQALENLDSDPALLEHFTIT